MSELFSMPIFRRGSRRFPASVTLAVLATISLSACGGELTADAESGLLTTDAGDVDFPTTQATGLDWTVTSDDYRRWLAAESALAAVGARDLSERIPIEAVSEEAMERVTDELEDDAQVRQAIEGAGLTVSRYVHTTVALEQALTAVSPDARVQFRELPAENIIVADRYGADIERIRSESPIRVVESDRLSGSREHAGRSGKQKARGKAKGHYKGKHKGKHKD